MADPSDAWFDEEAVLANMRSSAIGRTVSEAAENNMFRLEFSKSFFRMSYNSPANRMVEGIAFFNKAKVYLPAVGSNARAASVAVHEGIHMLGVAGSRRAEALARIGELMHAGSTVDRTTMRQILREMNDVGVYDQLLWKINRTSPSFPGVNF